MKRLTALLLALVILTCACGGCGTKEQGSAAPSATKAATPPTTTTTEPPVPQPTVPGLEAVGEPVTATLNGVVLSDYTLVYAADADAYTVRAVTYIRDEVYARVGAVLPVVTDDVEIGSRHEIVVGETNRPISVALEADTEGFEFATLAKDGHVAMEADYFVIAAAAYYFVTTYVTGKDGAATVPATMQVRQPITEKANNYIILIGDGMGINHTLMPQHLDGTVLADYTDGENLFYGYLFPYQGMAHTNSLNNTTDSAASATALASGYKTNNGYVGRGADGQDLKTLTELAGEMGMSTAVMSTEVQTGATIAGFSAHANDRDETENILASQAVLQKKYGTIIDGDHDVYTDYGVYQLTQQIAAHLNELNQNEKGFFMMYEEAYIDKHSHEMDEESAAKAVLRFNRAIAVFMEFAFYNPDTFILITADHETGGLGYTEEGGFLFSRGSHTGRDVPVFAYGAGAEVFHDTSVENVQIPKTISKMWGNQLAADTDEQYPPLN